MSAYQDRRLEIRDGKISIKEAILPFISSMKMDADFVRSIEPKKLSLWQKLRLLGSNDLRTWWTFDLKRPLQKQGFIINIKKNIGPFNSIGVTVEDFGAAERAFKSQFRSKYKGGRKPAKKRTARKTSKATSRKKG